ncbi:uncharacterized protein LOC135384402 [Ornithodoros turicata]|uniref:uncharacterized protein LOC135384402 n=1 Tax=Ornithodoros turicata TaxID=34597 RepID=UPI00313A2F14
MSYGSLPSLPPFLELPGKPYIPGAQWRRMFENYLDCVTDATLSSKRKKALLLHALGKEGQRIFFTLPVPQVTASPSTDKKEEASDPYAEAIATLEARYAETFNVIAERRKFRRRSQLPGEMIDEFVTPLRGLAATCNFGSTLEEIIRDQLVENASLPQVRERLMMEGSSLTLERALTLAKFIEQSNNEVQLMRGDTPVVQRLTKAKGKQRSKPPSTLKRNFAGKACYRCGSTTHLANSTTCPARDKECRRCKKRGRFASVCRSAAGSANQIQVQDSLGQKFGLPDLSCTTVLELGPPHKNAIYITVTVNKKDIRFVVDTGSSVTILSRDLYEAHFAADCKLEGTSISLHNYSKQRIPVLGSFFATVTYGSRTSRLLLYVVPEGTALLGLDGLAALGISIDEPTLQCLRTSLNPANLQDLLETFAHLFSPGLGLAKDYTHRVKTRNDVAPVRAKLRRLPFALREEVTQKLDRLLKMDVIEPVTASEWISPIVVARKKDGKLRLCVDLRGPNKAVVVDAFPLPTIDELLYQLAGAKVFSKLDLTAAYHQVLLAPESRDLTAFIIQDCPGVKCYLDDIIVFGVNEQDHLKNLHRVLQLISEAGLKLNDKCVFGVRELTFVGHTVTPNGISPNPANLHGDTSCCYPGR